MIGCPRGAGTGAANLLQRGGLSPPAPPLSFPYHIGAGVIGASLPSVATYLAVSGGQVLSGVWYPVLITSIVGIVGSIVLPTKANG